MFDLNDFIATMHDVVLNAEENDVGMFDLVDIAANYINEKTRGGKEMKVYSLKEHKEFENAAEGIMFEALDNEREVPIVITVGNVSIELPMCADDWEEICFALKECYEVEYGELPQTTGNTKEVVTRKDEHKEENKMSKITDEKWGHQYISSNGNKYVLGQVMADYWVIVDQFEDISALFDSNVLIEDKLITYVYGETAKDIEDFVVDRIDYYEKHERRVNFRRDMVGREDTLYSCYLGSEDEKPIEATKDVPVMKMVQMANEDR